MLTRDQYYEKHANPWVKRLHVLMNELPEDERPHDMVLTYKVMDMSFDSCYVLFYEREETLPLVDLITAIKTFTEARLLECIPPSSFEVEEPVHLFKAIHHAEGTPFQQIRSTKGGTCVLSDAIINNTKSYADAVQLLHAAV